MFVYEIITNEFGSIIKRADKDGEIWWIPCDPTNSDYQAYLASLKDAAN